MDGPGRTSAALRLTAGDPGRLGSIGLIGSSAKWARFRSRLLDEGHAPAALDRISCPVGLATLRGKEPAVIAVGVVAALLERFQRAPVQPSAPVPAQPGATVGSRP